MMGPIEQGIRDAMSKAKELATAMGTTSDDPNFHLSLIAGTMMGYVEKIQAENAFLSKDDAADLINGLYAILGDYEQLQFEKGINGD